MTTTRQVLEMLTVCWRCLAPTDGDDEACITGRADDDDTEEATALCGKCMRERGQSPDKKKPPEPKLRG